MKYIQTKRFRLLSLLLLFAGTLFAQSGKIVSPTILYSGTPREYYIGGINVTGADNYEPYIIIGLSGLNVGDRIKVPGEEVTTAIKRYWKHGLFSDVSIVADSIVDGKIYLGINLKQGYNGDLTSRQAGSVGGQMVKKMIESYENSIK